MDDANGATSPSIKLVDELGARRNVGERGNANMCGALLALPPSDAQSIAVYDQNAPPQGETAKSTISCHATARATPLDATTTFFQIAMEWAALRCCVMHIMPK